MILQKKIFPSAAGEQPRHRSDSPCERVFARSSGLALPPKSVTGTVPARPPGRASAVSLRGGKFSKSCFVRKEFLQAFTARIAEALRKTWAIRRRGSAGPPNLSRREPRGTPGEAPLAFSKAGALSAGKCLGEIPSHKENIPGHVFACGKIARRGVCRHD